MSRGAYFLANDYVYEQAVAFLNSFRTHNATTPLCLVPFNDDADRIRALATSYSFSVFADDDLLRECDDISVRYHDEVVGQYRKLAMWSGGFDEFVYIDTDTVLLHPVDFVFPHLEKFDFITACSNAGPARKWVWRDSIYQARVLNRRQIAYAANTGFVVSRREALPLDRIRAGSADALALRPHMELLCREQPLLNYLIVTSERPHTSLLHMYARTQDPHLPQELWAGGDIGVVDGGRIVPSPSDSPALLVHWAGEWQRARHEGSRIPHHELWEHYRRMPAP